MNHKKIRILYTIPNFDTAGSGIALMKLIMNLDRTKFEPHILCIHDRGTYFKEVVSSSGVQVHLYPYTGTIRPYRKAMIKMIKLSNFIRKGNYDIVFSYHYAADYIEAIASRLAGAKFYYAKKNMSWYGPSYRAWRVKTFFANKVFVQNTDMIKDFYKGSTKVSLVSIGVDTKEYYPQKPDEKLKEEFGLKETDKVVLCVANIVPIKGIDILIKAFEEVNKTIKDTKLLIIGDDRKEIAKQLKKYVNQKSLSYILFTGKRFDVKRFYSIADMFVLPSIGDEGGPISIQEAIASGVIVIATDVSGSRDQLKSLPKQLANPKDIDDLAKRIIMYLNVSEKEKNEIINEQLNIVNRRYSLEAEVKEHEKIYLKALG